MILPRPFTCFLVIFSFFTRSGTNESSEVDDSGVPELSWIDQTRIQVLFPDGSRDIVALQPADNIAGMDVPCLYEGTLKREAGGDVVVSGCKDHPVVSITIHSNRLIGRTMFDVRDNVTQEIQNPYANRSVLREVFDDEDEAVQRGKRNVVFEDYVVEDYDEDYSFDGIVPPRLKMDVKLGFEESLKTHLGGEDAARDYVAKVFVHGRSYMKHKSLGTSLTLNLAEPPIYVPNKHWKARRSSMAEAKKVKKNEAVPIIYFCFDGDDDNFMGVSRIRRACDAGEGVGITKYRANIQVAANTYAHEQGHLVGLKHDKEEDRKKANGNQASLCHGHGLMSEIAPAGRPEQFTACNDERFKSWYHNFGITCLTKVNIPDNLKKCPYPSSSRISPCKCMADESYNVFLFCESFDGNVSSNLAETLECRKKIHKLEVNMHTDDLEYLGSAEDIGTLEIEYFHLYNVSKITTDFEADIFKGSWQTIKEFKIEQLPKLEKGRVIVRTGSFSNLAALENVELGRDFHTIESKAFSGLPSIVNLKIEGVESVATNAFFDMAKLSLLDLSNNSLSLLPSNFIQNAPKLTTINLSYNSLTSLPNNAFQNLPSLVKLLLNNNKIVSINPRAMTNLPKLQLLDLSHNPIEEMGTCLYDIKNKDLILRLNGTKMNFLPEDSFKTYVEAIINQGGGGYVDVDSLELDCGCDIKWMFGKQHISAVDKFHNALCEDGHSLEEINADMLEALCPLECMTRTEPVSALLSQREEQILKRNNLITTLPRIGKEYVVTFDFKATSLVKGYSNIIHLTTLNRNTGDTGGRFPAFHIYIGNKLYGEVNLSNTNHGFWGDIVPANRWINIQARQKLENGKYMFTFLVNGEQKWRRENTAPREFNNVKVYSGNPWHDVQQGSIRNLIVE